MNNCSCGALSDPTTNDIEQLLRDEGTLTGDNKLVYIVAIDSQGNLTPLIRDGVDVERLTFPIETSEIRSIDCVSFGTFKGSCCGWYKKDGDWKKFTYPC
jgi:hypothetical protein